MNQRDFGRLRATYASQQMCVFTGAGVSFTAARHYSAPGWWDLLYEVYRQAHAGMPEEAVRAGFRKLRTDRDSAWGVASAMATQLGGESALLGQMRRALVGRTGRDARYKRLPRAYLLHARTLNAVISFCSRIRSIRKHLCLKPNPKIRAVLTANYDWFLEGGATQKYNANPFKPMARASSREHPHRLPVYHIHGYVPHGLRRKVKCRLVLTEESYARAYREGSRGWTVASLDRFLPKFPTLFVGFSFEDRFLMEYLTAQAARPAVPSHFALLRRSDTKPETLRQLRNARVTALLYGDHSGVPDILGAVYRDGLPASWRRVKKEPRPRAGPDSGRFTPAQYWQRLLGEIKH